MPEWVHTKAFVRQRQIKIWKKRHLRGMRGVSTIDQSHQPVFGTFASRQERDQELDDFIARLRKRS